MIRVIHGEIWSNDFSQLDQLCKDFSSCVRFAFCRFQKEGLSFNDVRTMSKWHYQSLNARQVADAVLQGQSLFTRFGKQKVIFGSKKLWNKLKSKTITKEEFNLHKNGQMYSRGDKNSFGNLNIRIIDKTLRITIDFRKYVFYNLFIPKKFQEELQWMFHLKCAYNVQLIKKDKKHYQVIIQYETEDPPNQINFKNGAIGIDTNPDRIAVCEINRKGNYIKSFSLIEQKIFFASTEKREYEIALLVQKVINYAKETRKGIVFEDLNFKKYFDNNKKFNRIKSNFVYHKFLELLERKCIEFGIFFIKVNPAYTSIIGKLKYKDLYKISVHESAAFVIARRGLRFNEKLSLKGYNHKSVKEIVLLILKTLEGNYKANRKKRFHSWKLWKCLKDNLNTVLTGLSSNISNLKELDVLSFYYDKLDNTSENLVSEISSQKQVVKSKTSKKVFWQKKDCLKKS
jgi:IS605 OrfB family transposase